MFRLTPPKMLQGHTLVLLSSLKKGVLATPTKATRAKSTIRMKSSPATTEDVEGPPSPSPARDVQLFSTPKEVAMRVAKRLFGSPSPVGNSPKFATTVRNKDVLRRLHTAISEADVNQSRVLLDALAKESAETAPWALHGRVLINYAYVCMQLNDFAAASIHLSHAVGLFVTMGHGSSAINARLMLAYSLVKEQRIDEAAKEYATVEASILAEEAAADQASCGIHATTTLDPAASLHLCAIFAADVEHNVTRARELLEKGLSISRETATRCALFLSLARLVRRQKNDAAALEYYLRYLTTMESEEGGLGSKLSHDTVFEIAVFQHYTQKSPAEAIALYERASELIALSAAKQLDICRGDAQDEAMKKVLLTQAQIWYNAGMCYAAVEKYGAASAVGVFEEAIAQMEMIGMSDITARMRLNFARCLRDVDYIDRSLEQYLQALDIVQKTGTDGKPRLQQSEAMRMAILLPSEVHGHLAHLLHHSVGDYVRAERHYELAMNLSGHTFGIPRLQKSEVQQEEDSSGATMTSLAPAVRFDTYCWILEAYGSCLLTTGKLRTAKSVTSERIRIGEGLGDCCVQGYIILAAVYEGLGEITDAKKVLEHLMSLQTSSMTTLQRYDVVRRMAWLCHYSLHDYPAATKLYELMLELEDRNPQTLVQYSWCRMQSKDRNLALIAPLYDQAVRLTLVAADSSPEQQQQQQQESCRCVFDEVFVYGECAVFAHDTQRDFTKAKTLYEKAIAASKVNNDSLVQVLANYAVLTYYEFHDQAAAQQLFDRAIVINANHFNSAHLYAEFLISTDHAKATEFLKGMVVKFPQQASQLYHKLAKVTERHGAPADNTTNEVARLYMLALATDLPHELASDANKGDTVWCSDERVLQLVTGATDATIVTDFVIFIHGKLQRLELAKKCYQALLSTFPNNTILLINYAKLNARNKTLALALFTRAMMADPFNQLVVENFSEFIVSAFPEQLTVAESLHLAALQRNPQNPHVHFSYACFLVSTLPSPNLAQKHFLKSIELSKHFDVNIYATYAAFLERHAYHLGDTRDSQHPKEALLREAEGLHRKCVDLCSTSAHAHCQFGLFLWRQKRLSESWVCLQDALEKEPCNPFILRSTAVFVHDRYAMIHNNASLGGRTLAPHEGEQLSGLSTYANALFEKALKQDPMDVTTLMSYSRLMDEVMNKPVEAQKLRDAAEAVLRSQQLLPSSEE